jgi:hypothetical protein
MNVGGASPGHAGSAPVAGGGQGGGLSGANAGGAAGNAPSGGMTHGGGGGSAGSSAACQMVKSDYMAELEKQLACNPSAGSQCLSRAVAAPGCECRVFIQPGDPFAIEHLTNVADGWYAADCSMPICPAKCTTASAGNCQADSKSPLGGRCVTP